MHLDHDHTLGEHTHEHTHTHSHEHTHDGVAHSHAHDHAHEHEHGHDHDHEALHAAGIPHTHEHSHDHEHSHCDHACGSCGTPCEHTPMEELTALMKYMVGHNASHARELAELATQLEQAGNHMAYEQVMAAVSDFEKGNLRLSAILSSLETPVKE